MSAPVESESFIFDPHSSELQGHLYEVYRVLRERHPVYHNPQRGIWVLSRYEDVVEVLRDPETFSSSGVEEAKLLLPMLVFMNDPRHRELRGLLSAVFTPRRVAALEPGIRSAAGRLIDRFARDGHCELMRQFAAQLPSIVISELIGIPGERRKAFLSYTEAMIETGPGGHPIREPAAKIYLVAFIKKSRNGYILFDSPLIIFISHVAVNLIDLPRIVHSPPAIEGLDNKSAVSRINTDDCRHRILWRVLVMAEIRNDYIFRSLHTHKLLGEFLKDKRRAIAVKDQFIRVFNVHRDPIDHGRERVSAVFKSKFCGSISNCCVQQRLHLCVRHAERNRINVRRFDNGERFGG